VIRSIGGTPNYGTRQNVNSSLDAYFIDVINRERNLKVKAREQHLKIIKIRALNVLYVMDLLYLDLLGGSPFLL
jgi:hypothetical protein